MRVYLTYDRDVLELTIKMSSNLDFNEHRKEEMAAARKAMTMYYERLCQSLSEHGFRLTEGDIKGATLIDYFEEIADATIENGPPVSQNNGWIKDR